MLQLVQHLVILHHGAVDLVCSLPLLLHPVGGLGEDFTGDGKRELFTAGFNHAKKDGSIDLKDLKVNGWVSANNQGEDWKNVFEFNPFESISPTVDFEGKRYGVTGDLSSDQLGVVIADMNLDNFQDVVVAFKVGADALRFVVIRCGVAHCHSL